SPTNVSRAWIPGIAPSREPRRVQDHHFRQARTSLRIPTLEPPCHVPRRPVASNKQEATLAQARQPSAKSAPSSDKQHYSGIAEQSKETMTTQKHSGSDSDAQDMSPEQIQAVIDRILSKDVPAQASDDNDASGVFGKAQAISTLDQEHSIYDGDQEDLAERRALRRTAGLSTELEDVTEVEYRQLRLERVVLAGLWTEGTLADAEN